MENPHNFHPEPHFPIYHNCQLEEENLVIRLVKTVIWSEQVYSLETFVIGMRLRHLFKLVPIPHIIPMYQYHKIA